jgi:protein arginine N-methyltransferase 1
MGRPVSLAQLFRIAVGHQKLLADGKRNRAFTEALRRVVTPGSRVLDIGAGTGVWAVTAAHLGAARVVAIERDPLMAPVIAALARENGVGDRVHVVTARAHRAALPREFDLVVSETIGLQAFDEGVEPLMADARRRLLKPGGRLMPESLSLLAAPVRAPLPQADGILLRTAHWQELMANLPQEALGKVVRMAPPVVLRKVRLGWPDRSRPDETEAAWTVREAQKINAVALWSEMQLAPGVRLSTLVDTSWAPVLLPVGPFKARRGTLRIRIGRTGPARTWRTSLRSRAGVETQDASPMLAYGALRAQMTLP